MKISLKVIGELSLAMIFWAFSFVWVKQAYTSFNPSTVVLFRLVISALLLFVILKSLKRLNPLKKKDLKWFMLLAFFEPFMYFVGESFGLKYVSSTMGAVIISTIPLFAPIADRLFFKTRITWLNIFGLIISFAGVLMIVLEKDLSLNAPLYGIAMLFVAVLAAIGYTVVLKKIPMHYNAVTIITYQNAIGSFYFLPLFLTLDLKHFEHTQFSTGAVLAIVQLAIFASSAAFILYTNSIRIIGITKANAFVNMIPVFTAIFAWWLLNEPLSVEKFAGIAIVITGVFISQVKRGNIVTG
jgi:drug/metabolite transporter (DMT)-like permease